MSADPSPLDVETTQQADANEDAKPAKSKRMHHLDYIRAILILGAVYLHVDQIFGVNTFPGPEVRIDNAMFVTYSADSTYYEILNQADPDWKNDYAARWLMQGRQICIPLLFWISGYALALSKEKALSSLFKVAIITVIGMFANFCVFMVGPRNDDCNWIASQNELKDVCKGWLMDFGIGVGSGIFFSVLFQFWFTLFMMVFLLQLHPLFEGLREVQKGSEGQESGGPSSSVRWFVGYYVLSAVFYIGLLLGWSVSPQLDRTLPAIMLTICELATLGSLVCAVACPPDWPRVARLLQYLAALMVLIQFNMPDLKVTGSFDGSIVVYFHIFKHFCSLGFVMGLKRKQTQPVVSQYYPIMLFFLIITSSTTNFYLAGVATYPYFPYAFDRMLWGIGGMCQMFCHDRAGHWATEAGTLLPLPQGIGMGALMSYVFHVPMMAVFSSFAGWGGSVGVCIPILIIFWAIAFAIECRGKKTQ